MIRKSPLICTAENLQKCKHQLLFFLPVLANLSEEGFATYRLRCKSGEYIAVQSRGYLEYDRQTQKIESFMCVNTVLREDEGERHIQEQRDKFTPYIVRYKEKLMREQATVTKANIMVRSRTVH